MPGPIDYSSRRASPGGTDEGTVTRVVAETRYRMGLDRAFHPLRRTVRSIYCLINWVYDKHRPATGTGIGRTPRVLNYLLAL